jgi:hypothetical protein
VATWDLLITGQPVAVVSKAARLSLVDCTGDVVSPDGKQGDRHRVQP